MRHPCAHPDCETLIDTSKFMCPVHWLGLPSGVRSEVAGAWQDRVRATAGYAHARESGQSADERRAAHIRMTAAQAAHEVVKAAVVAMLETNNG